MSGRLVLGAAMPLVFGLAVALALALAGAVPTAATTGPGGDPGVSMTIANWGEPTSIDDPKHKAWAHLSANAAPVQVTVRVDPHQGRYQGFLMTFSTPDAFDGPQVQYCSDEFSEFDRAVQCTFQVPISRGANRVDLEFHTGSASAHLTAHGIIYGGDLKVSARIQVLDATGHWGDLTDLDGDGTPDMFTTRGEQLTGVRYLLINTGDIPVRPIGACTTQIVLPGAFVTCLLRGKRTMFALAGPYRVPVHLEDPAGGSAQFVMRAVLGVPGFLHGPNG